MRYRTKMILIYTGFVLLLALAVGLIYYNYSLDRFIERERQALTYTASELAQEFDNSVMLMEFGISSLASDIGFIEAVGMWAAAGEHPNYPKSYIKDADAVIHSRLYRDSLSVFHRVIVFNRYGNVVANRNSALFAIDPNITWRDITWLDQVSGKRGKNTLVGLHQDDWGSRARPTVYSYVKELQGDYNGYIEVQYTEEHLMDILKIPDTGVQVFLIDPEWKLLYSSIEGDPEGYIQTAREVNNGTFTPRGHELVQLTRSAYSGAAVLVVMPQQVITAQSGYLVSATVLVSLLFSLVSMIFVFFISAYLTKPIEEVSKLIQRTGIENIGQPIAPVKSIIEIESLVEAYRDMTARLARSIQNETELTLLNARTQFDALQAQVNPHFLFNVLNVISLRGMADGDDTICEICASLAAILRYSTNTKKRLATIQEEIQYLEQYVFLLTSRYQHKFSCTYAVDPEVCQLEIPRLTIQQLVENSVNHGYQNSTGAMNVQVEVTAEGGGCRISVADDGQGFPEPVLAGLTARFAEIKSGFSENRESPELEIGGMGIANVYARLYLVFGDRVRMELANEVGARVTIYIEQAE